MASSALTLPDAVNAVGACPDAMPRAWSLAVADALGQVHGRIAGTLRPADFAGINEGPTIAVCESEGLRLPALRFGSTHRQVAYALLGSSAFIEPTTPLDAHIGVVFVSCQHAEPVHFDVWLSAPGNGEAVQPSAETITALGGVDNGGMWQAANVVVPAPPMVAHGPVILTVSRHQPDPVDLLYVTVTIEPRPHDA